MYICKEHIRRIYDIRTFFVVLLYFRIWIKRNASVRRFKMWLLNKVCSIFQIFHSDFSYFDDKTHEINYSVNIYRLYTLYSKIWWPSFFALTDRACEVRPRQKRGHHIFPYKVYNLFITYFQFRVETYNYIISITFFF
jgi:hypothetical protein